MTTIAPTPGVDSNTPLMLLHASCYTFILLLGYHILPTSGRRTWKYKNVLSQIYDSHTFHGYIGYAHNREKSSNCSSIPIVLIPSGCRRKTEEGLSKEEQVCVLHLVDQVQEQQSFSSFCFSLYKCPSVAQICFRSSGVLGLKWLQNQETWRCLTVTALVAL